MASTRVPSWSLLSGHCCWLLRSVAVSRSFDILVIFCCWCAEWLRWSVADRTCLSLFILIRTVLTCFGPQHFWVWFHVWPTMK
jgi:hypothetical protein